MTKHKLALKRTIQIGQKTLRLFTILIVVALLLILVVGMPKAVQATERTFYVNSTDDEGDPWPGDGICDTDTTPRPPPVGECTLRAALLEIYGLYMGYYLPVDKDTHTITVPAGTYNLTLGELGVGGTSSLTEQGGMRPSLMGKLQTE